MNKLYIVVPCYNEEAVLRETAKRLQMKINTLIEKDKISPHSKVVFVNDGSSDGTWGLICALHKQNVLFSGINLSKNRGHQNALLAGLMTVKPYCDVTISIDADLQDDIEVMDDMIEQYLAGCDIVYGVRSKRDTDTWLKRWTAECFYKLMQALGADTVFNHADYRLMSQRALDGLAQYGEVNLFLRGIVPMIGLPTGVTYFERQKRFAGASKYPFRKMLSFALQGITSFSTRPMRMITFLGLSVFAVSIVMLAWSIVGFYRGTTEPGWASLMVSIWGIGGLLILSVGIVGEYIGKIYLETKGRPRYLVETFLHEQ